MPKMFREMNQDDVIQFLQDLQESLCCYGTKDGDGRSCDCKYIYLEQLNGHRAKQNMNGRMGGEVTGCCEARAALRFLKDKAARKSKKRIKP